MANDFKENFSRGIAALETRLYGHNEELEKVMAGYNPSSFCAGFLYAMTLVKGLLTQMPDAVEVVHGRWVAVPSSDMMTGKAYKCSECNKMRYGSFMPNYCQNCGAKMDGERKDNG